MSSEEQTRVSNCVCYIYLEMQHIRYNSVSRLTVVSRTAKESRINTRAIIKTRLPLGYIHITMELVKTPTETQCYLTNIP